MFKAYLQPQLLHGCTKRPLVRNLDVLLCEAICPRNCTIRLCCSLRNATMPMLQSWLIAMFLDCPPGMGLHCPNETSKREVENAIHAGIITWHAFPHNAQVRMGSSGLLRGVNPGLVICAHAVVQTSWPLTPCSASFVCATEILISLANCLEGNCELSNQPCLPDSRLICRGWVAEAAWDVACACCIHSTSIRAAEAKWSKLQWFLFYVLTTSKHLIN